MLIELVGTRDPDKNEVFYSRIGFVEAGSRESRYTSDSEDRLSQSLVLVRVKVLKLSYVSFSDDW